MTTNRKNIRAEFHDYSGGDYFVTICTRNKEHYFGKITRSSNTAQTVETQQNGRDARFVRPVDVRLVHPETQRNGGDGEHGEMVLSTIGRYCREQMESISAHYPYAAVSLYVIMPNHIHAIITVNRNRAEYPSVPSRRTALSVVMGGLKRAVTMYARRNGIDSDGKGGITTILSEEFATGI